MRLVDTNGNALELLREHTDKPIAAVIYTHLHPDHYGGTGDLARAWLEIPVYGPAGWQQWAANSQVSTSGRFSAAHFSKWASFYLRAARALSVTVLGPRRVRAHDSLSYPPTTISMRRPV